MSQNDHQYGTLLNVNHVSNISHTDLLWHYKIGFEAMSNVEYQHKNGILFTSPIIENLKYYHQNNIRLQPIDFKQIPLVCIPSMLKHSWTFEEWDNSQILKAISFSLQASNKHKKRSNQITILLQIIKGFNGMGGIIYPFDRAEYKEDIIHKLAEPHVILYTKCVGIKESDIEINRRHFLSHFNMELSTNKAELNDLDVLAQILNHCYGKEERYVIFNMIWKTRQIYKKKTNKTLEDTVNIYHSKNFEINITKIIGSYL